MIKEAEVTESLVCGKALMVGLTHTHSLPHSMILSDFCQKQDVNHTGISVIHGCVIHKDI